MTTARLENWSLHFSKYGVRLTGYVFGHTDYTEGASLSTLVKREQLNVLDRTITTRTAVYALGCAKYQGGQR